MNTVPLFILFAVVFGNDGADAANGRHRDNQPFAHQRTQRCTDGAGADLEVSADKPPLSVAMVLGDEEDRVPEAMTTINSMLTFRTCPIHLYMLVDRNSRSKLSGVIHGFHTHRALTFTFVDLPDNVTLVTDGMDSTFRAKFTLVKASVERLLPTDVDHLVVTDIDVLWVGDICDAHGEIDAYLDWHPSSPLGGMLRRTTSTGPLKFQMTTPIASQARSV